MLLLGGQSALATGGRTLVYPGLGKPGHRQLSNVWNTMGHVAGTDLAEFGGEGSLRRAPGPLAELLA